MIKKLALSSLMAFSLSAFAGTTAGDVNFGTNASPENHAIQYRLNFNGAYTDYTICVSPNTGYAGLLTVYAMGSHTGPATIQARDCYNSKTYSNIGSINYDPQWYYNIACTTKSDGTGSCS